MNEISHNINKNKMISSLTATPKQPQKPTTIATRSSSHVHMHTDICVHITITYTHTEEHPHTSGAAREGAREEPQFVWKYLAATQPTGRISGEGGERY